MDTLKKAGTPHVLLRLKTLHIIFDGVRKTLGDQYLDVLRCIGETVGFSFSVTLIDYLERDKSKIPFDYDALLGFWSLFDSRADMGTFTVKFDENNEKIEVIVDDNFLVKGYENDKHRHCAFFEGYIEGILDGAMCQWTRWIENSIYRPPRELWQVIRVKENRKEEQCLFTVEIMKEKYRTPRNLLVNAIQEFKKEDYNKAMLLARRSLEFAIKEPIHLTDADKIKFTQLVKAYQKYQIALSYQKWFDLYDIMSEVGAHSRKSITGDECLEHINLTRKLINEWSGIDLDEDTVTKVKGEKQKYGIF
jgi:predicted hydrocarbon binding protein